MRGKRARQAANKGPLGPPAGAPGGGEANRTSRESRESRAFNTTAKSWPWCQCLPTLRDYLTNLALQLAPVRDRARVTAPAHHDPILVSIPDAGTARRPVDH
jgi:hypothetical protein